MNYCILSEKYQQGKSAVTTPLRFQTFRKIIQLVGLSLSGGQLLLIKSRTTTRHCQARMEAGNNESGVTLRPDLWTSPVLDNLRGATSSSYNCGLWNHEKFLGFDDHILTNSKILGSFRIFFVFTQCQQAQQGKNKLKGDEWLS
jgi:hypothetical protein